MVPTSARKAGRIDDLSGGRPTIGYLAPRIGDNVSQALWTGIVDAAREQGANPICFVGDSLCELLDEQRLRPQVDFDAVVTVSDVPALGALEELQARGIRVPEDVALVGFNGARDGRFSTPPLTTVRLPFYEQGHRAVEMLHPPFCSTSRCKSTLSRT